MKVRSTMMPTPKYRCHKTVSALKIAEIVRGDGETMFASNDSGRDEITFTDDELQGKPTPEVGWYFVHGYFSFSPAKTFEEGYTLIS